MAMRQCHRCSQGFLWSHHGVQRGPSSEVCRPKGTKVTLQIRLLSAQHGEAVSSTVALLPTFRARRASATTDARTITTAARTSPAAVPEHRVMMDGCPFSWASRPDSRTPSTPLLKGAAHTVATDLMWELFSVTSRQGSGLCFVERYPLVGLVSMRSSL